MLGRRATSSLAGGAADAHRSATHFAAARTVPASTHRAATMAARALNAAAHGSEAVASTAGAVASAARLPTAAAARARLATVGAASPCAAALPLHPASPSWTLRPSVLAAPTASHPAAQLASAVSAASVT